MTVVKRSQTLSVSERTQGLERTLTSKQYRNPEGDFTADAANRAEWIQAIVPFLVDWNAAKVVTGGEWQCSNSCMNEVGD